MPRNSKSTSRKSSKKSGRTKRKSNTPEKNLTLINKETLDNITKDNSFLLNPVIAHCWFQEDLLFARKRAVAAEKLHDLLFDPSMINQLEPKELISLYSVSLNDIQKQKQMNMKFVEMSDKHRLYRDTMKLYQEQEKRKAIQGSSSSHVDVIIDKILDESLRHSLDDQMLQQYQGSNSFKPKENAEFTIEVLDENADE